MNDALRIGGDAGEVGAVEDRTLQCSRFEQRLFGALARAVVSANQQVADDAILNIAQSGDRHHGRESAAVLADVGELVDIFNATRGLEYQRLKARSNRSFELHTQGLGPCNHLLWIGNIRRSNGVEHFQRGVSQHALGTDVKDLNDALRIGGDAGEVGAVKDRVLQCTGLKQSLFC